MNKIISFSLWGNTPKYCVGAIKNAKLAPIIYPDWITRFYVGTDVSVDVIKELQNANAQVITCEEPGWNGMFWRFFAADSEDVVLSRDTDSRINLREKHAVDAWLNSDKPFHIMRDHPHHNAVILGGMWGSRNSVLKGITRHILKYKKNNQYQVDQNFLRDIVYPRVKNYALVHDEFFENKPFPSQRIEEEYVGAPYNENDQLEIDMHGKKLI